MARRASDVGSPPKPRALTLRSRVALGVPNASGLAALPGGAFLVVDDDHGIYHADRTGKARLAHAKSARLGDLEGIAFDGARDRVVVVCEERGAVVTLAVKRQRGAFALGAPESLGSLPAIGRAHNKGWEGIAWVPAGVLGSHETLLAVHEGKPKRLGVFAYPELETRALCELPAAGKKALCDLSDVAFEPATGRVWILSDESRAIATFALRGLGGRAPSLELHDTYALDVGTREKPEGLCIDGDTIWVATDGEPYLYELRRPRRPAVASPG